MEWTQKVGKILLITAILVGVTLFPGIFSIMSENEGEKLKGAFPIAWTWSPKDLKMSALEIGCSLPLSHCEWRPYHRRVLSYFLCNIFVGAICAALFYPAYVHGFLLPLPSVSYFPIIRIGAWDIIHR